MKKLLSLIFFILLFSLESFPAFAGNFGYPFDKIAAPSCRFNKWSTLGDDCKITLPKIVGADYGKYKLDQSMRRIYSILWGSTYDYGWDAGMGSHLGVDIATSEGTPVISIGDGEVIIAGLVSGYGNTVVIKHQLSAGKYIYSNYSHLSKVIASKGAIKIGEIIGEVGNTGNSYGNHLHFQIDITNQFHPYWYNTCSKGIDIMSVVNGGMCRDFMITNTVDPILFLESGGTFTQITQIQQKQKQMPTISASTIKTREQILQEEIEEFFKGHQLQFKIIQPGANLSVGTSYIAKLSVNFYSKQFTGSLPGAGVEFIYDKKALKVFPEKIIAIENGSREIYVTGLKSGSYNITLKIGNKNIYSTQVITYKSGELGDPTDATIITKNKEFVIGDENIAGIIFKTKFGTNQLDIPYNGKYKVKLLSGKAKFCNVSNKYIKKCNYNELTSELNFTFADSYRGILLFNIIPLDYMPIKLAIYREGSKYEITSTRYQIPIKNPLGIDNTYSYFGECINVLKKGLFKLNQGYLIQDREILGKQVKELISNFLAYEFLRSGNNLERKNIIKNYISKFNLITGNFDDYMTFTRGNFAKIFLDITGTPLLKNNDKIWLDESGIYKDYITTLRKKFNFSWKDQFSERYFQTDKKITVGEALYFVDVVGSKLD